MLGRSESRAAGGYAQSVAASSTADLYPAHDPYAVPPLPHMNPAQPAPYHDDPGAPGAFYDPYSGPVPPTLAGGPESAGGHEAIPMTQLRAPSPGPGRALSPQPPQMSAFDPAARTLSPAPPQAGYGYDPAARAFSPAPSQMGPMRVASPGAAYTNAAPAGYR
jgi:hypothetical protein